MPTSSSGEKTSPTIPSWVLVAALTMSGGGAVVSGVSSNNTSGEIASLKSSLLENIETRRYLEEEAARLAKMETQLEVLRRELTALKEEVLRKVIELNANRIQNITEITERLNRSKQDLAAAKANSFTMIANLEKSMDDRMTELGKILAGVLRGSGPVPQSLIRKRRDAKLLEVSR